MDRLLRIDFITQTSVRELIDKIDEYNRNWKRREQLDPEQLQTLKKLAAIHSIGSSTRIEGSSLSDEEVARLIDNMDITQLASRDEQEVAGYYRVLDILQEQYEALTLSETLIKGLHNELLRFSAKDQHHRGDYKKQSNRVVATDEAGNERTIFNTTSVMLTPEAMRAAVDWYNGAMEAGLRHPLIVVFTFIYEFLSIHPFQDGNGRLSRLLTNFLLLKAGYEFVLYRSLERGIEDNKKGYYKSLMLGQRYRGKEEEEIGRWLFFMLSTLHKLTQGLDEDETTVVEEPQALYLNRRMRNVLDFFKQEDELSVKEIDELLPAVSRSTVKNDLAKLTKAGYLKRHGKGRGTVYTR
ncbi:MAG: Fic family protein [Bacteroidota bacterium]